MMENKNQTPQFERYMLIGSEQEEEVELLTAEKTDPQIMTLLAAAIAKVFDDVYATNMPLRNLADCLRIFYNIQNANKSEATMRKLVQAVISESFEGTELEGKDVAVCTIEEIVNDMEMDDAKDVLGITYLTIRSYLDGRGGLLGEADISAYSGNDEEV